LIINLLVFCSEFGADSDDDSCHGDDGEEKEKLKRRKFIMNEFRRRRNVSVLVFLALSVYSLTVFAF